MRPPRRLALLAALLAAVAASGVAAARRAAPGPDGHTAPFVRRVLASSGGRWVEHRALGLHVHAPAGSRAARVLPALAAQAVAARDADLRLLGATIDTTHLELLALDTREAMRPFTGGTPGGWAESAASAVLFVTNDSARAPLRHELMHVLSWQRWGTPAGHWISEGLAMHAVGRCHGRDVHAMAAALAAEGRLVPLAELPRRFDVQGEAGAAMYVQAGSFVRHVLDTYGTARLRALWQGGLRSAPLALGADVPTLERAWRARVDAAKTSEPWAAMWAEVRSSGCE
ncbi:hypothetical protein [Roseisolibacter agri]|uniref:Peptidase MA-like domain-containing protein n=1 Tax=Roseisolibacter agri TaxID=2014610 RepID=A0AA37Q137_9BACT|nr:hypothetical protein [Roseisolibacter agri]GLC24444.1 hypothetical protein rosag_09570 [Roseisolibacter agri]